MMPSRPVNMVSPSREFAVNAKGDSWPGVWCVTEPLPRCRRAPLSIADVRPTTVLLAGNRLVRRVRTVSSVLPLSAMRDVGDALQST